MLDAHDSLKFILVQNVGMHTIHVSPCKINVKIKACTKLYTYPQKHVSQRPNRETQGK